MHLVELLRISRALSNNLLCETIQMLCEFYARVSLGALLFRVHLTLSERDVKFALFSCNSVHRIFELRCAKASIKLTIETDRVVMRHDFLHSCAKKKLI